MAQCAERKKSAIALLDEITRCESIWWIHEEPSAAEVQTEDEVFA